MRKIYVILGLSAAVLVIIVVALFGKDYVKTQKELSQNSYIFIDNNVKWEYRKGYWYNLEEQEADRIMNQFSFQVYQDKSYVGVYYLKQYDESWYFFDSNNNSRSIYGKLFAYSGDKKIQMVSMEPSVMDGNDDLYYRTILNNNKISYEELSNLSTKEKLVYDFDGDGQDETLYAVSNVFSDIIYSDRVFSFVYLVDDGEIELLISENNPLKDVLSTYSYSISYVININDSKDYQLILEGNIFRPNGDCYKMFQRMNGRYRMIKAC